MLEQQLPKPAPIAPETQDSGEPGRNPAEPGPDRASPYNPATVEPTKPLESLEPLDQSGAMPQRIPIWLQRTERIVRVIVYMYIGLGVCLAPWFPLAWEANPLFIHSPGLLQFISHGYVRGMVSGLGLLNLYIALREAIQGARDVGES